MAYNQRQQREHIREIQKMLYGLSLFDERMHTVVPNGVYGKETAIAVRAFQQIMGLRSTGEINAATWEKLRNEYYEKIGKQAYSLNAFPQNTINIGLNDEGLAVYIIQIMLHLLSINFGNFDSLEITGKYDSFTENAVKEFQKRSGQSPTGKVDRDTWNLLVITTQHGA